MSHSPTHSSLTTPTPALAGPVAPVTPPRAPPTPPESVNARDAEAEAFPSITQSTSQAQAQVTPSASLLNANSPTFAAVVSSSPDSGSNSGSTSLSSPSNSSTASSISFVLSAPGSSQLELPFFGRSFAAAISPPAPSLRASLQSRSEQCTPTTSPASSQYHSPLASPTRPTARRRRDDHGDQDSPSESSDVEVFLTALGLDDSTSGDNGVDTGPVPNDSPVLPSSAHCLPPPASQPSAQTSPQLPPAPAQQTIPLPEVDFESQFRPFSSAFTSYQSEHAQKQQSESSSDQRGSVHQQHLDTMHEHQRHQNHEHQLGDTLTMKEQEDQDQEMHGFENSHKTPNVYINGLPPHFPEDQLFALASPFGEIRSVRTFTRHVRESESGYGFVLFETIEAAEKCIVSLRRYRNLHPTFSKQVHKIPGTPYSQPAPQPGQMTPSGSASSQAGWEQESRGDCGDASFKAKLESLHDPTSTNLYMEGLPMSIDEPTLAALVSPHLINSSRFFQTRLSNPPRIIAFVRLETRAGAEEIIERLHGRMVRGWNDTGSRISVRFADTAEQRELRRTERMAKDGDHSPARLTIAQAALLNLRGSELRPHPGTAFQGTPLANKPSSYAQNERARHSDFSSNSHFQANDFLVDYSLAPSNRVPPLRMPASQSSNHYQHHETLPNDFPNRTMDPAMAVLLDSLRNTGVPLQTNNAYEDMYQYAHPQQQHSMGRPTNSLEPVNLDLGYTGQHSNTGQRRTGFNATEEFIMRAHADSNAQSRRPPPLDLARRRRESDATSANIALGLRGYRAQASSVQFPQRQQTFSPTSSIDAMSPMMSEEEFHASARADYRQARSQFSGEPNRNTTASQSRNAHTVHDSARLSRAIQPEVQSPQITQQSLSRSSHQHAHMRSTTLPHRSSSTTQQHQRHYQHSSMSIPNTNSIRTTQHHHHNSMTNKNNSINDSNSIYDDDRTVGIISKHTLNNYDSKAQFDHLRSYPNRGSHHYDVDQTSPSLISPALTYASHPSPSTLSPATPFFGSFGNQADAFERPTMVVPENNKKYRAGSQ